ncbi:MAG: hypothetical protein AB7U45_06235 [Desulfamplus sp.]
MNISDILKDYENSRPCGYDGMSINAKNWNEAHDYHRAMLDFHQRCYHPPGIIAGLEVIATSPASSTVVICPGIATDCSGREIVVREKQDMKLQNREPNEPNCVENRIFYIYLSQENDKPIKGLETHTADCCKIERTPTFSKDKIELARIQINDPIIISDAKDPLLPGKNEIDMTNRWSAGCSFMPITIAYCDLLLNDDEEKKRCKRGINHLVRYINHNTQSRAVNVGDILVDADLSDDICLLYIPINGAQYQQNTLEKIVDWLILLRKEKNVVLCCFSLTTNSLTYDNNGDYLLDLMSDIDTIYLNKANVHPTHDPISYLGSFCLPKIADKISISYLDKDNNILYSWSNKLDFEKWLENNLTHLHFGYDMSFFALQRKLIASIIKGA